MPYGGSFWTANQVSERQVSSPSAHRFVGHEGLNGYLSAALGPELLLHGDPNSKSTRGKNGLDRVKFVVEPE